MKVLVALGVAARGLDIDELPHVINFELPHTPGRRIANIGASRRQGTAGCRWSPPTRCSIWSISKKLIKIQVEQVMIPGFEPEYDYKYPPTGKKKHHRRPEPSAPAAAPGASRALSPQRRTTPSASHCSRWF